MTYGHLYNLGFWNSFFSTLLEQKLKLALLQILYPVIKSDSLIGVEVPFKMAIVFFSILFFFTWAATKEVSRDPGL